MFAIGSGLIYDLSCLVVSHRIGLFMETSSHISMADTIGRVYGKIPRIITALASVNSSIVVMALQITVTSRALQACVSDVNPNILMVISASIVMLYSVFDGIQSVTITDILQCATFTIIIPYKAVLQSEKFQFAPILQDKTKILSLVAGFLAYFVVDPTAVQRTYMARNS